MTLALLVSLSIVTIDRPVISPTLLLGLAHVESELDPKAVGDNGDSVGMFQIQKIYVDDANRILEMPKYRKKFGEEVVKLTEYPYFFYNDRWNILRSKLITKVCLTYLRDHFTSKGIQVTWSDLVNIHCWTYSWEPSCNKTEKGVDRIKKFQDFLLTTSQE